MRESLTNCLRDLHLPTRRRDYESAAERARQESSSYEAYLLDLAERECEARRADRVEVRWPSGRRDVYERLAAGAGYRLREGDPEPRPLAGFAAAPAP